MICITAVEGNASDLGRHLAAEEITAATRMAMATGTAMPAHAHALARFPLRDTRAHSIHDSDHFVAGHAWILQPGPTAFLHERITVADATSLDFNPHPAGAGFGEFTFNDFKRPAGAADLGGTRFLHKQVENLSRVVSATVSAGKEAQNRAGEINTDGTLRAGRSLQEHLALRCDGPLQYGNELDRVGVEQLPVRLLSSWSESFRVGDRSANCSVPTRVAQLACVCQRCPFGYTNAKKKQAVKRTSRISGETNAGGPTAGQLARCFHLNDADRALIAIRLGDS